MKWEISFDEVIKLVNDVEKAEEEGWTLILIEEDQEMGSPFHIEILDRENRHVHAAWYTEPDNLRKCLVHMALMKKI